MELGAKLKLAGARRTAVPELWLPTMDASIPGRVFSIQRPREAQEVGTIAALLTDSMNGGRREGQAPYYFNHKDGAPLMFTGIWQEAEYKGDKRIAFAIRVALWPDPE